MSQANGDMKYKLENDTAMTIQSAAGIVEPIISASVITSPKRPQKLKDFSSSAQALMPKEWEREADIFSPVPKSPSSANEINPSNVLCASRIFNPATYENNYFMWAIFNNQELARNMIVEGINVDVDKVTGFGRQSPLFAALTHFEDGLIVEYLCMVNANLDISHGGGCRKTYAL